MLTNIAPGECTVNRFHTDWQSLLASLLVPTVVVTGLIGFALQPQWEESGDWIDGVFVLVPLEFVRAMVFRILRDAYSDFRTPWQKVGFFLLSLAVLAGIGALLLLLNGEWRLLWQLLTDPAIWRHVLPPLAIIVVDSVVGLWTFRGDGRVQAACLDAMADDAEDWFMLGFLRAPFLVAALYAFLIYLRTHGASVPHWVPEPSLDALREITLLYVAAYFGGKAIVLAHAHTAHFQRTGKRVLGASWIQFIVGGKDRRQRAQAARTEQRAAETRRATLLGEERPGD